MIHFNGIALYKPFILGHPFGQNLAGHNRHNQVKSWRKQPVGRPRSETKLAQRNLMFEQQSVARVQ